MSFQETINELQEDKGNNISKWKWGDSHSLTLEHPLGKVKILNIIFNLNRGPFKIGGGYHTVCRSSYNFSNLFFVTAGASQRNIYSIGNWDESISVIPTGISGNPASKHYCDQTDLYMNNKYHKDYYSKDKVKEIIEYKMVFKP